MIETTYPFKTYKKLMKTLKPLFLALTLSTTAITTQAAESTIPQQKQVSGYYQYQAGEVQITALLDGTNFMSPKLFQNTPEKEVHEILKKYAADQAKGVRTSVNSFLVNTGHSLVLVDSGAASCFGAHLGSVLSYL